LISVCARDKVTHQILYLRKRYIIWEGRRLIAEEINEYEKMLFWQGSTCSNLSELTDSSSNDDAER